MAEANVVLLDYIGGKVVIMLPSKSIVVSDLDRNLLLQLW